MKKPLIANLILFPAINLGRKLFRHLASFCSHMNLKPRSVTRDQTLA